MWPNREARHSTTSTAKLYHHFPFAFKAITEVYLYPLHAQYLVMYRTEFNTKISGTSFRKSTIAFCSVHTALRKEKSHYKILGIVVFWVTTLCNPTLACQRFERNSCLHLQGPLLPCTMGQRVPPKPYYMVSINHNLNKLRYRNPLVLCN
jgi:hypothetical protein